MSNLQRYLQILIALLAIVLSSRRAMADEALADATHLYMSSQWQRAADAFDRLAQNAQKKSTRLMARIYAGESLMQLGKYAEAQQHYQHVQQQHPPARLETQSLFRLGEAAWLSGDGEEASTLLNSYLEKHPRGAFSSYAKNYLEQIHEQRASQADFAELDEAVGWERDGRHDAALAAYRKLLDRRESHPNVRAEVLRRAAKLHDRLDQSREAIQLYRQFFAENPDSRHAAEVLSAIAWLYERLDQTTQAADQFRTVLAKFPQSTQASEAVYWLARLSADEHDTVQSMQYVDWLLTHKGFSNEHPELWGKTLCLKCQLAAERAQWQEIDELVETALGRLDEGSLNTKLEFWAAEAAFRLRKYDVARTRYAALQPKTTANGESWTAMVPLRRAQLAARRQQWGEVLKTLDQLELDYPEFELDYEIDYLRGRAMAGRGGMTAARRFYRQVLDSPEAIDTEAATMAGWMIGETYFHQRDYARARAAYQNVIEQTSLVEWQSRAALQAGKCWELEQRWDEAASTYTMARERWPDTASDQELESRIRWAERQFTQQR